MAATGGGGSGRNEGAPKIVADQISQSVQSTSNLLHLMLHSSPSREFNSTSYKLPCAININKLDEKETTLEAKIRHYPSDVIVDSSVYCREVIKYLGIEKAQLMKLPRNLLAMTSTIKNTESVLEQMPQVISSLDTHVDRGLQCLPHLDTVVQLLSNMQNSQLKSLSRPDLPLQQDLELSEQDSRAG